MKVKRLGYLTVHMIMSAMECMNDAYGFEGTGHMISTKAFIEAIETGAKIPEVAYTRIILSLCFMQDNTDDEEADKAFSDIIMMVKAYNKQF